jgi:DNA repair protein RadC
MTDKQVREKLVARGPESLTDAELLAVLLQEGTLSHERTAELAEKILSDPENTLTALSRMDIRQLRMVEGIGIKRAALLSAALELGRRLALETACAPTSIRSNDDVLKIFQPQLSPLPHEEFWVLYLSSANTVLDKAKVSQGGVSATVVDHKLIVKRAVELLASGLILVHNHPSGVARPSSEDRFLTDKIELAASLFDIRVLDHLIITAGECFSFRKEGLIK